VQNHIKAAQAAKNKDTSLAHCQSHLIPSFSKLEGKCITS